MGKASIINTDASLRCECGNFGKFVLKSGKVRCAEYTSQCPAVVGRIKTNQRNLKPNPTDPIKLAAKKAKLSNILKARYANGWESTAGRCKKYNYNSPIAGIVSLDGTWEIIAATYLDSLGVEWVRNKERFNYVRPDGKDATYQPDFYVATWDMYIEVKGYETVLDRAKWSQFPHTIQVWKRDKIEECGRLTVGVHSAVC